MRAGAAFRVVLLTMMIGGCASPSEPDPSFADFVIDVAGEQFVVRISDPATIQLAEDNRLGRNQRFPLGTLRSGNGSFNAPWTWHLDPGSVRFVEVAIELCDGRPSYVETHQADYPTYCPWGGRVVGRR